MPDWNYTVIFETYGYDVYRDDICWCGHIEELWGKRRKPHICTHPKDPRITYTKVIVEAVGNPIFTRPTDTVYRISIYQTDTVKSMTTKRDSVFTDDTMISQFSIKNSLDTETKDYIKFLTNYLSDRPSSSNERKRWYTSDHGSILKYNFSGRCSIEKYILYFYTLRNMLISPPKKLIESDLDNPHFSRRMKKK
jgi:hypothetical protein